MLGREIYREVVGKFAGHFGRSHTAAAYAPGRVEVLGNHTDYNEGFVLSAAINLGTFFLAAPSDSPQCRVVAGDIDREVSFDILRPVPSAEHAWANYVIGVAAGFGHLQQPRNGFLGMFLGNIPLGAGLSSSAALEMSAGLALADIYGLRPTPIELARIGQAAEHHFVGVKCGLLDQISSLFAQEGCLVMTDFRTLNVETVRLSKRADDVCFLMCNTHVKHSLVASAYNERRQKCEEASHFFASHLAHPVQALRDVSLAEWKTHSNDMDPAAAKRSHHVIGENARVQQAHAGLLRNDVAGFGRLMYESHESSRRYFENSCPELDFVVDTARTLPGVFGARLSGGGFGGSTVILVDRRQADVVAHSLAAAYLKKFGGKPDVRLIVPSAGAACVKDTGV